MQRRTFLAAALAAAFAAPAGVRSQAAGTIVIGQSTPLSGINKELGEDIRDGANALFKKVNDAGGVNGRRIELVSLDDANDVKRAEANTRTLIEQNNALALFGYGSATLSRPALPLVESAKVTFFAPFTGAESMRKFNRHVYNHRASYADELERIVEHYATFGLKRFAILHFDDPVGQENMAAVDRALKARNLTAVAVAAVPRKEIDLTPSVNMVLKATPDVIITTTLYKTTSDFVKLARGQGSNAQFVSTSFAGSTALANELGKNGIGVAMAQVVPSPMKASIPVVREYQQALVALTGKKEFSFTSLESYIAAKALVEGIRRAGPNPSREALLKALDTLAGYDAGGYTISFSPTNHNGSRYVDLTILGADLAFRN
jgi:ABC-type branched-subunit amino acid transport system substrate-binding protein